MNKHLYFSIKIRDILLKISEFNTIFASRPKNLPPKDKQEELQHRKMIELQKKTFLKKFREDEQKKVKILFLSPKNLLNYMFT